MKSNSYRIYFFVIALIFLFSCDEEWLDVKREKSLIVPTTLRDLRLLLRNESVTSRDFISLIALADDDYYVPAANYQGRTLIEMNSYIWKDDLYENQSPITDWDQSYNQVVIANVILDQLAEVPPEESTQEEWNDVKGGALHLRARAFYNLAQTFCKPYDPATASIDPGIPLRLTADVNAPVARASVQETYDRIVSDLLESTQLLREQAEFIRDPSRTSAHGWLARCFLAMGNYTEAESHANQSLVLKDDLIDFNTLNSAANNPITAYNIEVLQHSEINPLYGFFVNSFHRVPDVLRLTYDDNDLRKVVFFRDRTTGEFGRFGFKGTYTGASTPFSGVTTSEMFLIRSESRARIGQVEGAIEDLNTLLRTRYRSGTYTDKSETDPEEVLKLILDERRKELLFRGLRWSDLRRLNKDPRFSKTLSRNIDGVIYNLPPDDPKYVMPIPQYVITSSSIAQNPR